MAQVVRRERRHTCGGAGTGDGGAEPVAAEPLEHLPFRGAVLTRHKPQHGVEHARGDLHPSSVSRLRYGLRDAPAAAMFVDVAPPKPLELAEPHPGRVEHDQRQPIPLGEHVMNGQDVLGGRRRYLGLSLARQPDGDLSRNGLSVVTPA